MEKKIIIVGGGAAGMTAAIAAARQGIHVVILEHKERLGKKILSTGNGKCNLTNLFLEDSCYYSNESGFPLKVINCFDVSATLDFFSGLGFFPKIRQGYVYPKSEQASSVRELLCKELNYLNVDIVLDCQVTAIKQQNDHKLSVQTNQGTYHGDAVVLASGSQAAPATGSDGSGYQLAAQLGHHIIKPLPALVQLCCDGAQYKQMAGVRTEVNLQLWINDKLIRQEQGELQITDYGISGIPTFQLSRHVSLALLKKQKVVVYIDFFPEMTEEECRTYVESRKRRLVDAAQCSLEADSCENILLGALNKKLTHVLLKMAGIRVTDKILSVSKNKWQVLIQMLKRYPAVITATKSFEQAQVCCGGVDTKEVDAKTLESKIIKKLFFAGEILDVDGICGGYNLQFAWSSGMVAGRSAAQLMKQKEQS